VLEEDHQTVLRRKSGVVEKEFSDSDNAFGRTVWFSSAHGAYRAQTGVG
jgi:hypothetical protein